MSRSMNKMAVNLIMRAIELRRELRVGLTKVGGATVIDMGLKSPGGFEAGLWLSKICMGGLGQASLTSFHIGDTIIPAVAVHTDHPLEACMASQYAGWRIKVGDYFAMGSGPARALAKKPKGLYDEIAYSEESDEAVIALEADKYPSEEVIKYISDSTNVSPENLYVVVAPTNSVAGSVQVSARIVETGIHKFHSIGFDIKAVRYGFGIAPVAPLHPNSLVMMGRTNDMLLYGGSTFYIVDYPDESKLKEFVEQSPSIASKDYGRSLAEVVMEVGVEFLYKLDPKVFAPAVVEVNSVKSGLTYRAGCVNYEALKRSIGL